MVFPIPNTNVQEVQVGQRRMDEYLAACEAASDATL